jgi:hypothetical protein
LGPGSNPLPRALPDHAELAFRIFSTRDEDARQWHQLLGSQRWHDVFFGIEYARAYERSQGCEVLLASYTGESGRILMPFALRDLRRLPFMARAGIDGPVYDMTSLYPFGGPIAFLGNNEASEQLHHDFHKSLAQYCDRNRIVAQFTAFHPLLENHRDSQATGLVEVKCRKEIVWIDLSKDETALFREMSAGHRGAVSRARRCGVVIEHHPADSTILAEFTVLYREMVRRVGANERWNFPDAYFEQCAACLGRDHVTVFNARYRFEIIASALILHDNETAYYHLASGPRENARNLRPNHLLIFELALWAKASGYRRLLLGGGLDPNDGIFRFKAGFSKSRSWLYTSNVVYDQQLYRRVCEAREAWDKEMGIETLSTNFFPAYRG